MLCVMSQTTPLCEGSEGEFVSSAEANNTGSSYSFPHLMVEFIMTDAESFLSPFSFRLYEHVLVNHGHHIKSRKLSKIQNESEKHTP